MRSYPETYNPEERFRDKITLILKRVLVLIKANLKTGRLTKRPTFPDVTIGFPAK